LYFNRDLAKVLKRYSKFPVVAILGPRQSGKTTLAKKHFKKHLYVNLENLELRAFALEDPNRFLREYENVHGIIIDEFQYVPQLLSYVQVAVDEKKRPGYFILTGSQNFLMNQAITQSLAGRVGILTLLPLSLHELKQNKILGDVDATLLNGSYPRLYEEDITAQDFYPSYIHTYLERDVRQIAHVGDMLVFQKLMRLCAARIGQLLNVGELATNLGVDLRKVNQWLSVLEASYILFFLKPHFQNYNKRLTKTPKLYFYDTGLACSLLDIKTTQTLHVSPYRGHLFESLIVSDFQKQYYNMGISNPSTYFWRDTNGRIEIDCLIDRGDTLFPVEIKSAETISPAFFTSLSGWTRLAEANPEHATVVYGGSKSQSRSFGKVLSWQQATQLIPHLYDRPSSS
jgi:predicted AAA+ superfamily ATPase